MRRDLNTGMAYDPVTDTWGHDFHHGGALAPERQQLRVVDGQRDARVGRLDLREA